MPRFMNRIVPWLQSGTLRLIFLAGFILLIWGTFAPIGTIVWWLEQESGQGTVKRPRLSGSASNEETATVSSSPINCYIIFLTGVGDFSANQLAPGEEAFLDRLTKQHPQCMAVQDVFPYSAANESLGGDRLLAPLWRAASEADGWLENADVIIKIRNLWRFAISIDNRYGPVYNEGIASAVVERMEATYPIAKAQSPLKIILVGTSGGAQVALGTVSYLDRWLEEPEIIMISVGGDFSGTEGFREADQIYHLQGRQDWIEDVSRIIFPSRWPWTVGSSFNTAQRQGRYQTLISGPHSHSGATGYFGQKPIRSGSDTTYLDLTLQKVNQLPIWD